MEGVPKKIGRYEIRGELGRGMMGVVYEARDPSLNRVVALKVIRLLFATSREERETFERRFLAEARIAAILSHPGIVVVHDVDRDPESGVLFIALERLEGVPLSALIAEDRRPHWREALLLVARVAEALAYAHSEGVVHRDIKPANIMRLPSGEPKIMDFGLAKFAEGQELTASGHFVGTPLYMAPEQVLGRPIDGRTDLFSLGAVAYALLTGQKPFAADSVPRIMAKVAHQDPPPPSGLNPELPPAVDYVVQRAMAKAPGDRHPTGRALAEDIGDVLAGREPRHRAGWTAPERGEATLASARAPAEAESLDLPLQTIDAPRPAALSTRARRPQPLSVLALGMLTVGLAAAALAALWPERVAEALRVAPPASPSLPPTATPSLPSAIPRAPSAPTDAPEPLPVPTQATSEPPGSPPAEATASLVLRVEGDAAGAAIKAFVDDALVLERPIEEVAAAGATLELKPGSHLVRIEVDRSDRIETRELWGTFDARGERALALRLVPEGGFELEWR